MQQHFTFTSCLFERLTTEDGTTVATERHANSSSNSVDSIWSAANRTNGVWALVTVDRATRVVKQQAGCTTCWQHLQQTTCDEDGQQARAAQHWRASTERAAAWGQVSYHTQPRSSHATAAAISHAGGRGVSETCYRCQSSTQLAIAHLHTSYWRSKTDWKIATSMWSD